MQHFGKLANSPRLQRTLKVLQEAEGELSTRDIIVRACICNVSSAVSELRFNGAEITCRQEVREDGSRVWLYTLLKSPETPDA